MLLTGCSMGSAIPAPEESFGATAPVVTGPQPAPARPATTLNLAAGTCWTGELLGEDPQLALKLAATFAISYFDAAYATKDRPAFLEKRRCSAKHAIEVYRLVQAAAVTPLVSDYGQLMRTQTLDFALLSAAVNQACMDDTLSSAATRSGVAGASLQPALPAGYRTTWAPATLEQWQRGQRLFACLLVQDEPSPLRYAALRTSSLPTVLRTCIASGPRIYVDCARPHDRERIAYLDVSGAVASGLFPGHSALRRSSGGAYLDEGAAFYAPLDQACTAYLRSVSSDPRLSGVAEIDVNAWPDAVGRYAISCEADTPANKPSKVTQGSVYNSVYDRLGG
ncbi:hypothetical protein EFL95_15730 [Nocardioides marmorisolisilvae]|uniref:Uncharacterized protein n=1 Tax=Nocardioides marmorisolisilvae TaxID=1542737 RepID=A0A3N0DPA1_9ACTN|nr:hypothetical protein EFL95_15730 [Nocardioides marmorisolisilvae]